MGALCISIGPSVFSTVRDIVLSGVKKSLEAAGQHHVESRSNTELTHVSVTILTTVTRHIVYLEKIYGSPYAPLIGTMRLPCTICEIQ